MPLIFIYYMKVHTVRLHVTLHKILIFYTCHLKKKTQFPTNFGKIQFSFKIYKRWHHLQRSNDSIYDNVKLKNCSKLRNQPTNF